MGVYEDLLRRKKIIEDEQGNVISNNVVNKDIRNQLNDNNIQTYNTEETRNSINQMKNIMKNTATKTIWEQMQDRIMSNKIIKTNNVLNSFRSNMVNSIAEESNPVKKNENTVQDVGGLSKLVGLGVSTGIKQVPYYIENANENIYSNYKNMRTNQFLNSPKVSELDKATVKAQNDFVLKSREDYGKGNINLNNRKKVVNEDGSVSTERSISFFDSNENKEILIPTVIDGKIVSDEEAINHYYQTGENLGKFDTVEEADKYAQELHERQELRYSKDKKIETNLVKKSIRDSINKDNQKIQEEQAKMSNAVTGKLGEIAPSMGQMIPGTVLSAVDPYLGTMYFTTSAGGGYIEDALNRGMDDKQAFTYGTIMGALEGASESIITGQQLSKVSKAFAGKEISKKVLESYGFNIFENAVQEAVIEPAQEITAGVVGDKADWSNMGSRMLESGFNGALMGAISNGVTYGLEKSGNVYNKIKNGENITETEYKEALQENINKFGKKTVEEAMKKGATEVYQEINNLQQQSTQNEQILPTQQVNQEQNKVAQNGNMEQILPTQNDIKEDSLKGKSFEDILDDAMSNYEYNETPSPLKDRDINTIGKETKVNAYQYDNPKVKPYFQEMAQMIGEDIGNIASVDNRKTQKGGGTALNTNIPAIKQLKEMGYSYDQIVDGIVNIIDDHGKENNALSKKLEIIIDDQLRNGYTNSYGKYISPNQEYIDLISKDSSKVADNQQNIKQKQYNIIKEMNPMQDDYHTGIRNEKDIKTFDEVINDDESFVYGDFSKEDAEKALKKGKVTVYSSKPIEQGSFVSTSKNMAKDYAGSGKIYSQEVNLNDVAWINGDEGQYAKVDKVVKKSTKNNTLESRVQGDDLLDAQDLINDIKDVGAEVDNNGYVTLYHRTTPENARQIMETGQMKAQEDGLFFSTNKNGKNNSNYGDGVIELKVPAEMLKIDDIFDDEASIKIPLKNKNEVFDVSKYLANNQETLYNNIKIGEIKNINTNQLLDLISEGGHRTEEQVNNLREDIKKNGITTPIEIYKKNDGTFAIENGNHRLKIAQELGIKDIPVKMVESWENIGINKDINPNIKKEVDIDYGSNGISETINNVNETSGDREGLLRNDNKQLENRGTTERDVNLPTRESNSNEQTSSTGSKENNRNLKDSSQSSFNLPTKGETINKQNMKFDNKITKTNNELKGNIDTETKVAKILTEPIEKVKEKNRTWAILKANLIDKGMVFEELSRKAKNRELQGKYDYTLTANARGQYAIGNARYDGDTQISKSLTDIIDEVGENAGDFYNYMYHQLNVDRMTLEDRYGGDTGLNYERKNEVKNKPVFGEDITAQMSRNEIADIEKKHPEFKEYAQDVYDYLDANKKELVDKGVISQETADLFKEMYPHYVPIQRVGRNGNSISVPLDTGRTGINNPIKRAKGGSSDIAPLFETMADKTLQTYRASARNNFGVELKNTLAKMNQLEQISDVTDIDTIMDNITDEQQNNELLQEGKNGNNPTFTVFEDGNKVTFNISQDMYEALKPRDSSSILSKTFKIPNKISNLHRGVLTEYNPIFSITNAIKDAQDVLLNSQHSAKTYTKFPEAYAQIIGKGHWYQEYIQNGGEQNSYFKDGQFDKPKTNLPTKAKNVLTFPLKAISSVNNVIEMSPRLAEYIVSRENGASIETAMLDASRVTTNFKAGGDVTKFANRNGATFLNASVQGFQQQVRNIQEANAKGLKGYAVLATKYAIAGIPALILNGIVWKDDDDYEKLQDYVKDNYYCIAKLPNGDFIRIPKGRVSATIQKIVSNATKFVKDGKINADDVGKEFWNDLKEDFKFALDNVAPNNPIDNNIIAPIVQVTKNKTWYGTDLVPSRLKDLPAEEQFDESTDKLSKWLGEKIGFSPYKINYLINQYSGGVGDVLLPMGTPQAENNVIQDKFTANPILKNKYPGQFFEKVEELNVSNNSSKANDTDKIKYKYASEIQTEISDLYKQERDIQNSSDTDKVKKEKILEVQKKINKLAEDGLKDIDNIKISGNTAKVNNTEYYKETNLKDGTKEWKKISDEEEAKKKDISLKTYATYKDDIAQETIKQRKAGDIKADGQLSDNSKIDILLSGKYSDKEKALLYENFILSKTKEDNLDTYKVIKASNMNINEYLKYKQQEFVSDKEDDGTFNGKTVKSSDEGSKKNKFVKYINSMNITGNQRLLLYAIQGYSTDSSQKKQLTNYVQNLNIDKNTKLKLYNRFSGFKVYKDGTVKY